MTDIEQIVSRLSDAQRAAFNGEWPLPLSDIHGTLRKTFERRGWAKVERVSDIGWCLSLTTRGLFLRAHLMKDQTND